MNTNNANNGKTEGQGGDNEGIIMMKGRPCDFFILIIEGRVEVTIGKEEHKFQEGPFSSFGEQMLEQSLTLFPGSPMLDTSGKGNNFSLSMHSSFSQEGRTVPHLRKTATQMHISPDRGGMRSVSVDAGTGLPLPHAKVPHWIPDYSLRALTDVIYLKVRRNTYMVAVKASKMNLSSSDSGGLKMKEEEIEDVLAKVTENDVDFLNRTPSMVMSPDKSGDWPIGAHGTPADSRRGSLRSSFSVMKSKIPWNQSREKSITSVDKPGKDEVIKEGMTNSAMVTSEENFQNVDKRNNSAEGKVMEDAADGAKVIEVRGNDNSKTDDQG